MPSSTAPLKDGTRVDDVRLDRLPAYDERSRDYQVRQLLERRPDARARPRLRVGSRPTLDQGPNGACVGFSIATGANASPKRHRPVLDATFAREQIYWQAQRVDDWPGGAYPGATPTYEGTSTLYGLKVSQQLGLITSYYWCGAGSGSAIDDVVAALSDPGIGGVLLGIPWYRSMFTPDQGRIVVDPTSGLAGYHAIWAHSFRQAPLPGMRGRQDQVVVQNTWGDDWGLKFYGVGGNGLLLASDLETYLLPKAVNGEAAVPVWV